MELNELLVRLPEGTLSATSYADPQTDIYNIRFLTASTRDLRPGTLYFSCPESLPDEIGSSDVVSVVVYDADELPAILADNPSANAILLSPAADYLECYNALQGFFIEDVEVADLIRRMLTAHFSNKGLQYLVEEASRALGNPIMVVDSAYHYIARHFEGELDDSSSLDRILAQEFEYESILETGVSFIEENRITERVARAKKPLVIHNEVLGCNTMIAASDVRGITIAHTIMLERSHPFRDIDHEVLARLALFVSQEMQKAALYSTSQGQMDSYFLVNLLNDEQPSHAVTQRRLEVLDFHPLSTLYVAVLQSRREELEPRDYEQVAKQLTGTLSNSIYAVYQGRLAVLYSREKDAGLGEYTERVLREVARLNGLSVGVSNAFADLTHIKSHYEQANAAIKFGSLVSVFLDDQSLYHYCDYSYAQMLEFTNGQYNLLNFVHPSLMRLARYDRDHGSELMDTLFVYLQNSGNTQRAAKMLSLHKNTLLYRIGRIRKILDCDLASGEDQFNLQLSFRVLFYLGLFKSRVSIRRTDLNKAQED